MSDELRQALIDVGAFLRYRARIDEGNVSPQLTQAEGAAAALALRQCADEIAELFAEGGIDDSDRSEWAQEDIETQRRKLDEAIAHNDAIGAALVAKGAASRDAEVADLRERAIRAEDDACEAHDQRKRLSAEVERLRARVDHRERDYRECAEQRLAAQAEVEQLRAQLTRVTEERDGAVGRAMRIERELETYREEAEKNARVLLPAMSPGEHHDRAIARIIAERDAARRELDAVRAANESVAVCAEHTSRVIGDGCLVCELDAVRDEERNVGRREEVERSKEMRAEWAQMRDDRDTARRELDAVRERVRAAVVSLRQEAHLHEGVGSDDLARGKRSAALLVERALDGDE